VRRSQRKNESGEIRNAHRKNCKRLERMSNAKKAMKMKKTETMTRERKELANPSRKLSKRRLLQATQPLFWSFLKALNPPPKGASEMIFQQRELSVMSSCQDDYHDARGEPP